MFPQYSPLFTAGLMPDAPSPSSSRTPSPRARNTHDSLPLTVRTASLGVYDGVRVPSPASASDDTALFLTLKPRRRHAPGASFLSLDLADAASTRSLSLSMSMSLRRKDTVSSRTTAEPSSPLASSPLSYVLIIYPVLRSVNID